MTEPMRDERWEEINNTATMYGNDALSEEDFNAVLDEIRRLKAAQAIPPDVLAAMERYKGHEFGKGNWPYEGALYDVITLATWAVSHFGKDGV